MVKAGYWKSWLVEVKSLTIVTMPPRNPERQHPGKRKQPEVRQRRRSEAAALDKLMSLIGMRGAHRA
jgi:hypothetical protein